VFWSRFNISKACRPMLMNGSLSLLPSMQVTKHGGICEVVKKRWKKVPMSEAAYLDQAARWSKDLTRMKARGPGDTENAMRMIEREYGVDYWVIWRLRYRLHEIKDIGVSVYMKLANAYQSECERQARKLQQEIEITEAIAGSRHPAVCAAKAILD
jgi:hypothetical protein